MPTPPVEVAVSSIGQTIMTVGVAAGVLLVLVQAWRLGRRWRTWTAALLPLGTLLAACMMPLPDAISNMWYFRPGQSTLWSTYGVSLPVWTFLSYVAFYGGFGLGFWWLAETGVTRRRLVQAMGVMWLFALVTEVVGIQFDTYTYYGKQPFRVLDFPLWVSLYNVAICSGLGVASARLRRWLPTREMVVPQLFLSPALIVTGLIGTSFPVLQVSHTQDPSMSALYLAAIAALALAAAYCYVVTRFVPPQGLSPIGAQEAGVSGPGRQPAALR